MLRIVSTCLFVLSFAHAARAGTYFVEAEKFATAGGWSVVEGPVAKRASGTALLGGASGDPKGTASTVVEVKDAGKYKIWVRFGSHPKWRGPFRLIASVGERELGGATFDEEFVGKNSREPEVWRSFEAVLPEGPVTLRLSKHENRNSGGSSRLIDCVLLTMDEQLVPNHLHFGSQTFVRVKLGTGYAKPTYVHVFADHYHAPWYQHFHMARGGGGLGIAPKKDDLLNDGEPTPWCNVTPLLYQDSGAMLFITARHSYYEYAERLRAVFEFATAPDEQSVVRRIEVDHTPASLVVYLPPNLRTPENIALLKTNREIAETTGKQADAFAWPTHGKPPERFPFFVTASIDDKLDSITAARERRTLDYFGFMPKHLRQLHGVWYMLDGSYCRPDLEKMKTRAASAAEEFRAAGGDVRQVEFAQLTDEPTGQSLEFVAKDAAYAEAFRAWLKRLGRTPADLLVDAWDDVRPVTAAEREARPALYYFSQRFRTRALGDFMAVQRGVLEKAFGGELKTLVNFSDGAVYTANFYAQGVDYFELLDADDQNAIWGEDWANGSSTYQCAAFNVDLMRSAARARGQVIGHHLVAHAGRKPWDVKLKATSEAARGVKIFNNFAYGPTWATHEGGPYFGSHVWQGKPETWSANAAIVREIGAAEDLLVDAMPAPAKTALLYSSATDVWSVDANSAFGFDRMHTWLALAHAQIPVDVVHESQVAQGTLDDYSVCYLSGRNLTQAAADRLSAWVRGGGILWLTAGAATRDEFNRPLRGFEELLPVDRGDCVEIQAHTASGRYLRLLKSFDTVRHGEATVDVASVKQSLAVRGASEIIAQFSDGSPAIIRGTVGRGRIYCCGFLPALGYIRPALAARVALEEKRTADPQSLSADEAAMLDRSANPWEFPAAVRQLLIEPVRAAGVVAPVRCNTPLVDVVYLPHERGLLLPVANYTNRPLTELQLEVDVPRPVARAVSAVRGEIPFDASAAGKIRLKLPLENNDFVKLYWK